MAYKPKRYPRIDLLHMQPAGALVAAMDTFNSAMSILFCARPGHASAGFGAVVLRDDLPSYLGFAIAVEEAGHDIHRQLGVLLEGGVEDQDVNIVTGLMAATAQQVWREKNLTADQIRCVSIVLSTAGTQVDLTLWRRN
jgi:hypothetical protein